MREKTQAPFPLLPALRRELDTLDLLLREVPSDQRLRDLALLRFRNAAFLFHEQAAVDGLRNATCA